MLERQEPNGCNILVIEDDDIIRRGVVKALRRAGWIVKDLESPEHAGQYYDTVDVVLSDWNMPHGGGARVIEESTRPVAIFTGAPNEVVGEPAEVFLKTGDFTLVNAALLQLAGGAHPNQKRAAGK